MRGSFAHVGFSRGEEIAHAITHGLGMLLSIAGLVALVVLASTRGDARLVVGVSIYGASMVILYTASTMYHALIPKKAKGVFELMDHAAIYLLIAGSYTPFALSVLGGGWGWSTLGVMWGFAVLGIIYEVVFRRPWKKVSLALYLALGWLIVVPGKPLAEALPTNALLWVAAGGFCYTAGAVFYAWRGFRYHHAVWHLFVLAGSACHFAAVFKYVIPSA